MDTAPAGFTLPDLLGWIDDAHGKMLATHPNLHQQNKGFPHEFIAGVIAAIPEVKVYTVRARLEGRDFDGWRVQQLTERSFVLPRFAEHWVCHGGVANQDTIQELVQALMEDGIRGLTRYGSRPAEDVRISPLQIDEGHPSPPWRAGNMNLSQEVADILVGHRARHLQAMLLDVATPQSRSTCPARRV